MAEPADKTLGYAAPATRVPKAALPERPLAKLPTFVDLEVSEDGDVLTLSHSPAETVIPSIVLGVSTIAFTMFYVIGLPLLHVKGVAALSLLVLGLALLAAVGVTMQLRTRRTRVRLDSVGITIDQGTPIDREHIGIGWDQIAAAALEPIDLDDADKGMHLRIMSVGGEPIDLLPGVAIGDLTVLRRIVIERWTANRAAAAAAKGATKTESKSPSPDVTSHPRSSHET